MSIEVISLSCFDAISAAREHGNALLKYISNEDITPSQGEHRGYSLPASQWQHFTSVPPSLGQGVEQQVSIEWNNWGETRVAIQQSGEGDTVNPYRIVGFPDDFPFLHPDRLGDMLILVWTGSTHYLAWVLNTDADIEEVQANLGLEVWNSWAIYLGNDNPILNRRTV